MKTEKSILFFFKILFEDDIDDPSLTTIPISEFMISFFSTIKFEFSPALIDLSLIFFLVQCQGWLFFFLEMILQSSVNILLAHSLSQEHY